MDRTTDDAQREAIRLLRRYERADGAERTKILRRVAEIFVDLRGSFFDDDGLPDWRGKTWAYKSAVGEVFGESGIERGDWPTLQASIRYHVSAVLRERLSAEDLEAIGLRSVSARERSIEKRERQSAILNAARGNARLETPHDALRALTAAYALLRRIADNAVADLDAEGKKAARGTLDDLGGEVDRLGRASRRRGSRAR